MQDFKKESRLKKHQKNAGHTNYASSTQKMIHDATSRMKVESKIEINITREQLRQAKWLFEQAGKRKPDWLRQKFNINQRRKKCLNTELFEAQLDDAYCHHYNESKEWYDLLHKLWHLINGVTSCK